MQKANENGVTAVEYGLIGALISIVIMSSVAITGLNVKQVFCVIASDLEVVVGGQKGDCAMNSTNSGQSNGGTNSDSSSNQGDSDNSDSSGGDGDDSDSSMSGIQLLEAEGLDATLIPTSEGGTGAVATGMDPAINAWRSNSIMGVMEKLNGIDSIDTIYGLYSYDTNIVTGGRSNFQPLTTYNDALSFETDESEDMDTKMSSGGDVFGDGYGFAVTEAPATIFNIRNGASVIYQPVTVAQVRSSSGNTYDIDWHYETSTKYGTVQVATATNVATGQTVATTTLDTAAPYDGGSTIDLVDKTHYNVAQ